MGLHCQNGRIKPLQFRSATMVNVCATPETHGKYRMKNENKFIYDFEY